MSFFKLVLSPASLLLLLFSPLAAQRNPSPPVAFLQSATSQKPLAVAAVIDGQVYKESSSAPFYLIKQGKKLWIPSMNVLGNLGFTTAQVHIVPNGSLAAIPQLPDLAPPLLDALSISPDEATTTPSDVYFGDFHSPEPPPVFNAKNTQKDQNAIVIRHFYVAGWLAKDDNGAGPHYHCIQPSSSNPLCIEDVLYELDIDPDFLRDMYGPQGLIHVPSTVILPGNPSANARKLPFSDIDSAGGVTPNSLTLFASGDLRLHVELNSWHVKSTGYIFYLNWVGRGPAPNSWIEWEGPDGPDRVTDVRSRLAQNWWPYYPYDPDGHGTLQVGQYVIMRGTLWQDAGHDDAANGNSDMDKVGLTGQGAWLEMHPPDIIVRSRPSPSCTDALGNCRSKAVSIISKLNPVDAFSTDEQLAISTPPKPTPVNEGDSVRIRYEENVDTRFTTLPLVGLKEVFLQENTLQLHLRLANTTTQRGMFKASYSVWWELDTKQPPTPPRISVSPSSFDFGQQPVGVSSTNRTATVTNQGNSAASLNISVSAPFSERNTCGPILAPNAFCIISISFTPVDPSALSAVVSLGSDLPTIQLSGIGIDPPRSGNLTTDDPVDRINWHYQAGGAPLNYVNFQLCKSPNLTWRKAMVLSNGNFTVFDLSIQDNVKCTNQLVQLAIVSSALSLEFWKAGFLGVAERVRKRPLSEFLPLRSGSTLTFIWTQD